MAAGNFSLWLPLAAFGTEALAGSGIGCFAKGVSIVPCLAEELVWIVERFFGLLPVEEADSKVLHAGQCSVWPASSSLMRNPLRHCGFGQTTWSGIVVSSCFT
jgi:hypothetical protein